MSTGRIDPRYAVYFGCWGRVGHFFYDTAGHSLGLCASAFGLPWERVDGVLTPGKRDRRGRLTYESMSKERQGEAAIHHRGEWTALAVHDFSVDSRPGSNSVFFFHADLTPDAALASVKEWYPAIAARIGPVRVVEIIDD